MYASITQDLVRIHVQELYREAEANRLAATASAKTPEAGSNLLRRLVGLVKVDVPGITRRAAIGKA